jgi:hypothetical protein
VHRRKRERKPCEGMMLRQGGSRAEWLANQPMLDLIATMDDATSKIYSASLVEEEGTDVPGVAPRCSPLTGWHRG